MRVYLVVVCSDYDTEIYSVWSTKELAKKEQERLNSDFKYTCGSKADIWGYVVDEK